MNPCPDPDTPEALKALLAKTGADFLVLTPLPDAVAEVRFTGPVAGRQVLWRMRLSTLARFLAERGRPENWPAAPRGAMHLEEQSPAVWRAHVAVAEAAIDEPVIRKAILMMRNYRALRPGLRVWGDAA